MKARAPTAHSYTVTLRLQCWNALQPFFEELLFGSSGRIVSGFLSQQLLQVALHPLHEFHGVSMLGSINLHIERGWD